MSIQPYSYSRRTVFENLCPEIEENVFVFTDGMGLNQLSRVDKFSLSFFTNDKFKQIFESRYPYLSESFHFCFLKEFRPDICWKFATAVLEEPEDFFKKRLNQSFIFAGFPYLCKIYEKEKAALESEKKEICGSYPFDPSSPIHQAYERSQIMLENSCTPELADILQMIHPEEELELAEERIEDILESCPSEDARKNFNGLLEYFIDQTEKVSDEELAPLKREHVPIYVRMIKELIEFSKLKAEKKKGKKTFKELEDKRLLIETKLQLMTDSIAQYQNFGGFLGLENKRLRNELAKINSICFYGPNSRLNLPSSLFGSMPDVKPFSGYCKEEKKSLKYETARLTFEIQGNEYLIAEFNRMEKGLPIFHAPAESKHISPFRYKLIFELVEAQSIIKSKKPLLSDFLDSRIRKSKKEEMSKNVNLIVLAMIGPSTDSSEVDSSKASTSSESSE